MSPTIENPQYTLEELDLLGKKVRDNKATLEDYSKLDNYISLLGINNSIKDKMNEIGISSYEDYIFERNRQKLDIISITGTILGVISALKNL